MNILKLEAATEFEVYHNRLALDDSHATPIVTCARALEHLLSSSANEKYFQLCEVFVSGLFIMCLSNIQRNFAHC